MMGRESQGEQGLDLSLWPLMLSILESELDTV